MRGRPRRRSGRRGNDTTPRRDAPSVDVRAIHRIVGRVLKIMLCGASDTEDLSRSFAEVTTGLGGEPWHYRTGEILYLNTATASWLGNSRRTVAAADMCVFVILRRYGEITWSTELREALNAGKPFLILCLDSTYAEYMALTRNVPSEAIQSEDKRNLVQMMTALELERQLTVATFDFSTFKDVYRREAAKIFEEALDVLSQRARREALIAFLGDAERLTASDLAAAETLAIDEFEEKGPRKLAIEALMARGRASPDTVLQLLESREQGVQRLTLLGLAKLYTVRPPEPDFVDELISIGNDSDDAGVVRRLIPALFDIDVAEAVRGCSTLDLTEIGARRRLAAALEAHEDEIRVLRLESQAVALLRRCLVKSEDAGWLARCRSYIERLDPPS